VAPELHLLALSFNAGKKERAMKIKVKRIPILAIGVGVGAGLMYLLDPHSGRRRRNVMLDKMGSLGNRGVDRLYRLGRDRVHRLRGMIAETSARMHPEEASDEVLEARVRSKIGRVLSHPSSLKVMANGGVITLRGAVPRAEIRPLLQIVMKVRGTQKIIGPVFSLVG